MVIICFSHPQQLGNSCAQGIWRDRKYLKIGNGTVTNSTWEYTDGISTSGTKKFMGQGLKIMSKDCKKAKGLSITRFQWHPGHSSILQTKDGRNSGRLQQISNCPTLSWTYVQLSGLLSAQNKYCRQNR